MSPLRVPSARERLDIEIKANELTMSFHFMSREWACERLRLTRHQSYRYIPATPSGLVRSDRELEIINRPRRGIHDAFSYVPSDLMRPEELLAIPELAESGLTAKTLRNWAYRTKNPAPAFALTSHTIRYPRRLFLEWLTAYTERRMRRMKRKSQIAISE